MPNIKKSPRISDHRFLSIGLAVILTMSCSSVTSTVHAMDWADLISSNVNSWTGDTGASTNINFFNYNNTSGNTLTVGNANLFGGVPSQINGDIYGGFSSNPNSTIKINTSALAINNNSVTIFAPTAGSTAGTTGRVNVYGGFKYNSGSTHTTTSISNNTVTIHSGVDLGYGSVAGAFLDNTNSVSNSMEQMSNNHVFIYGGTMGKIAGAAADLRAPNMAAISNNSVTIDLTNGGTFALNVSGGSSPRGMIYGADFHGGSVTDNTVNFYANDSSTIVNVEQIIAGRSGFYPGEASRNTVNIDFSAKTTASPLFGNIKGGSSGNDTSSDLTTFGDNEAYGNNVYIKGSTQANLNVSEVVGGKTYNGIARNNNVYLTDVNAAGAIVGGQTVNSLNPDVAAGVADGNSVTILRGSISGDIYGGWDASTIGQSADGNIVNITDAVIGSNFVYGGFSAMQSQNNSVNISGYGTSFSNTATTLAGGNLGLAGNTLTTTTARNLQLGTIENFENYIFNMTGNEMGQTVYQVTNAVDFTGTNHTLNFDATVGPPLQEGQVMVLVDNTVNGNSLPGDKFVKNIKDGFLYNYEGYFGMEGDSLVFKITKATPDDRNVVFGHSQLVGLQMVNISSDLARSVYRLYDMQCTANCYEYEHWEDEFHSAKECNKGPVGFIGTQAGSYNWNSGYNSRVDLDYASVLTGLGWQRDKFLFAGFFEAGRGKYDTRVGTLKVVDNNKSNYVGGGALVRYENCAFYSEAGFHAGQARSDVESVRFGNAANPVRVKYKDKGAYFGIDALAGYKLKVKEHSLLDFSFRYSWNRVAGNDFTIRNVNIEQDSINSHRIITGVEWSDTSKKHQPYVGAFYEYEFDSTSSHKVLNRKLLSVSDKGSSGIIKVGVRYDEAKKSGFNFDIGIQGNIGKRRGFAGTAMLGYIF